MDEKKCLFVTVGLPRSGKTTWARGLNIPIVCPDAIRLALHGQRFVSQAEPMVWAIAQIMVRALFLAGHRQVVVDACHCTAKRRAMWQSTEWKTLFREMRTSKETCILRAKREGDWDIIPVIERMAQEYDYVETSS